MKVSKASFSTLPDVAILNRAKYGERLKNYEVRVGNDKSDYSKNPTCFDRLGEAANNQVIVVHCRPPLPGRYVRVQMFGKGILTLCEVLVFARMGKLLRKRFILVLVPYPSVQAYPFL